MLISQDLLFLLVVESNFRGPPGVGLCAFPDATAAHKNLSLQQEFAFASLTLHVIDRVLVLYVGIKTKNHLIMFDACSKSNTFEKKSSRMAQVS